MAVVSIVSIAASISAMVFAGPARLLRDGARRRVLQARRAHPSAVPHAGDLDRRPGGLERPARALRQRGYADDLHRLLGRAVRRCRRALAVRPQAARTRCAATLQGDRLSRRSRQSSRSRARSSSATRSTRISSCRSDTAPPGDPPPPDSSSSDWVCRCISSSGGDRSRDRQFPSVDGAEDHRPPTRMAGVRISAQRVTTASNPSLAANSRNDRGDPRNA